MRAINYIFPIVLVSLLTFGSCQKPDKFPTVPSIKYLSSRVVDTVDDELGSPLRRVELKFYLIDGDGNIGFMEGDTFPPFNDSSEYYHNVIINMFSLDSGLYDTINLPVPLRFRTPYLEPQGQNKTLKCTVQVDLDFLYSAQLPIQWDSVRFDFFMYDRNQNKSNIETTGLVLLK